MQAASTCMGSKQLPHDLRDPTPRRKNGERPKPSHQTSGNVALGHTWRDPVPDAGGGGGGCRLAPVPATRPVSPAHCRQVAPKEALPTPHQTCPLHIWMGAAQAAGRPIAYIASALLVKHTSDSPLTSQLPPALVDGRHPAAVDSPHNRG